MSHYYGDFRAGQTVRIPFNTVVYASGAPVTLTSGAVTVAKNGSDVTPSGGVTLTTDKGTVTGRHEVVIATATDSSVFTAGAEYEVRLSAGTASGVSLVGQILGTFSLANRDFDRADVDGYTPRQALAFCLSAAGGRLSGAGTGTIYLAAANDAGTVRITSTPDSYGNRTTVTLNPPI